MTTHICSSRVMWRLILGGLLFATALTMTTLAHIDHRLDQVRTDDVRPIDLGTHRVPVELSDGTTLLLDPVEVGRG